MLSITQNTDVLGWEIRAWLREGCDWVGVSEWFASSRKGEMLSFPFWLGWRDVFHLS